MSADCTSAALPSSRELRVGVPPHLNFLQTLLIIQGREELSAAHRVAFLIGSNTAKKGQLHRRLFEDGAAQNESRPGVNVTRAGQSRWH